MKRNTAWKMWQKGAAVLVAAAALAGCGGGGGAAAGKAATGTVATTNGTTATQLTVAAPAGVALSIPGNTTLTDASGNPVAGTVNTSVSYSSTASDLPAAAATLPTGSTLAGFADITMGAVKAFSQPVSLTLNVTGVSTGDTVELYSFDSTGSSWKYEGLQTVTAAGTITPTIQHLSIWGAFKAAATHPGVAGAVAAAAGDGQATLTWNAVTGATSYNVYYGTSAGVTAATGTKVAAATTSQAISGLTNGTKYYFVVTAVNAVGEGIASAEASTTPVPTKPAGVIASAGDGQVIVKWTVVPGITYNLYYSTTPGVTTASGTKIADVTSQFTVTGLVNGTTYFFVVTAVQNGAESGPSSEKSATPAVTPVAPGSPTGTVATAGVQSVTFSWSAVPTATSYNVYYLQSSAATAPTAATVLSTGTKVTTTATSATISGLTTGLAYYFNVTAVNAGGESGTQTNAKKATPL